MLQETQGLILKQMDFKDKDKIITILTKDDGKKSGILRGSKSLRSHHVATSEIFSHVQVLYVESPHRELVSIRKCEGIESYFALRQDYQKFLHACYFTELISLADIPPQDSQKFFQLLLSTLTRCQDTPKCSLVKLDFEQRLLQLLGLFPNRETCIHCGEALWIRSSERNVRIRFRTSHQLDSRQGGLRCPQCLVQHPEVVSLSPGTLSYWKHQFPSPSERPPSGRIRETLQNLVELDQAFFVYIRYHLGKPPKSHAFVKLS